MAPKPKIDQSDELSTDYKAPPAKDVIESPSKTIEQWAEELKVDVAMLAVAKATTPGWGIGRECTKDTFTAALDAASKLTFR